MVYKDVQQEKDVKSLKYNGYTENIANVLKRKLVTSVLLVTVH